MNFLVYRSMENPAEFVVTDAYHISALNGDTDFGKLEKVGEFAEIGESRAAFNERLARHAIELEGFYRFEAASFQPVPGQPEQPM